MAGFVGERGDSMTLHLRFIMAKCCSGTVAVCVSAGWLDGGWMEGVDFGNVSGIGTPNMVGALSRFLSQTKFKTGIPQRLASQCCDVWLEHVVSKW